MDDYGALRMTTLNCSGQCRLQNRGDEEMSAGKGIVARHLFVISTVKICACPELLLWFIRWFGRKIGIYSTICCTREYQTGDKDLGI